MAKKSLNVVILRFYRLGRHQTFVNDRSRAALLHEQVKGVVRCPKDYSPAARRDEDHC
jgi:hypothetical protein